LILTDRELQIAIQTELLVINPKPVEDAYSSTSVDLKLDFRLSRFRVGEPGIEVVIDPGQPGFKTEQALLNLVETIDIDAAGYILAPGILHLGWTVEWINLKAESKLAARIEGKSSLARLGLAVHVTAPTIHSGFAGRVRLEIVNHGPRSIRLRPNMPIAQLIVEATLGTPVKGYRGQFSGQGSGT
jgi:dCTP deaminase